MKTFKKIIREVYNELNKLRLFNDLLIFFIIFLIGFALLMITNLHPLFSLIPALGFLGYKVYQDNRKKRDMFLLIEKDYPELAEKLRTSVDNLQVDNPVVEELQEEVKQELRKVQTATFFKTRDISIKTGAAIILCFIILLLSILNVQFIDFDKVLPQVRQYWVAGNESGNVSGSPFAAGQGEPDSIFGKDSIAALGYENVDVQIQLGGIEPSTIRSEDDVSEEFDESFPADVDLVAACRQPPCVFANDIPLDQQELVKNYFIELAK